MNQPRDKIVILESDPAARESLLEALQATGYDVVAFAEPAEALEAIRQSGTAVALLAANMNDPASREVLATIRGAATIEGVRVILLAGPSAAERAEALDLGADDAISRPWDSAEILSRVRSQLRAQKAEKDLRDKMRIAEEGQHIAHTAFEALAVTEKMTSDAFSLGRELKIGVGAAFAAVVVMVTIYFLFARSAQHQTKNMNAIIAQAGRQPYRPAEPGGQGSPVARAASGIRRGSLRQGPTAKTGPGPEGQNGQRRVPMTSLTYKRSSRTRIRA